MNTNLSLTSLLSKIYLWQVAVIIAIALLSLGFTGEVFFTEEKLREGKGTLAIYFGAMFFVLACILRYIPPPERTLMTNAERLDRIEVALKQLLIWLAVSVGQQEALRIKAILEDDKTDISTES